MEFPPEDLDLQTDPEAPPPDHPAQEPVAISAEESDRRAVRALRRHVARHNWQALMLATASLALAVFLWAVIYVLINWLSLLVVTVQRSFTPGRLLEITDPQLLGPYFPLWFGLGALAMLLLAAGLQRRVKSADLRDRRMFVLWALYELFAAVPNVTFSFWGNLRAMVRLRRGEALAAWRVLERINALGGRLLLANVAVAIEDQAALPRVLTLLQVVELLGVRENEDGWFYYLQNREAIPQLAPPPPERRFY